MSLFSNILDGGTIFITGVAGMTIADSFATMIFRWDSFIYVWVQSSPHSVLTEVPKNWLVT